MPTASPMPTKAPGNVLTSADWNSYLRDNIDKLITRGHRVLTVAQFGALTGLEGTKGTVAPDEVYLEVDSANGIQWHLAYESGEPTYKWRCVGGPPMVNEILTDESTTSVTYADLATVGPSITLPRGGDYEIGIYALGYAGAAGNIIATVKLGAAAASNNEAIQMNAASAVSNQISGGRSFVRTALAAAAVLKMQYLAGSGTATHFVNRNLAVRPVRLI